MNNQVEKHKIFGRPRASQEEKRSVKVSVFLTEMEEEHLKINCEKLNLTLPDFLRRAALNKKLEQRKSVFDAAALEDLRTAGQNLNQTARELSRARKHLIPVDYENLELILRRQLEVLHALKIRIITED